MFANKNEQLRTKEKHFSNGDYYEGGWNDGVSNYVLGIFIFTSELNLKIFSRSQRASTLGRMGAVTMANGR
jgi:hypothetical protein